MSNLHTHSHGTENISNKVLLWTVIINLGLSVFEFAAGALSGSVALMADALHNTNDAGALLVAYIARKISSRGADETFTFGYRRAELIGAVIQLVGLIMVGLYLIYEAIRRLFEPQPLEGGWIIAAGGVALVVDFATAWLLWSMSKGNANVRAAFLHNLTDAGASIAVLFGGAAIFWLDWTWVDPAITLIIALYIIYISLGMLKKTSRILMEGTPPDLDLNEVAKAIEKLESVKNVHHLHIWELDEQHRALEMHVQVSSASQDFSVIKKTIKSLLAEQFDIDHSTVEIEAPDERYSCDDAKLLNDEH